MPRATVTRPQAADAAGATGARGGAGRRVRQLETKINRLEAELESVNAQLLDPEVARDHVRSGELGAQYRKLEEDIAWALAAWEDAAEAAGV
jgi:hypothetical protein